MSKRNTTESAVVQNPNDVSARALYAPVVAKEGTVDGKPARIALYGTRYAACEVGVDGVWSVHQDVGFGGIRGIGQLKGYFDDISVETPPVAIISAPAVEASAEFVPAASEPVVEPAPAVVEPVLATLDEVRAAFDVETRGACRASVLRSLRVRAGEIALGIEPNTKRAAASGTVKSEGASTRTKRMSVAEMIENSVIKIGDTLSLTSKPDVTTTLAKHGTTEDGRHLSRWCADMTGVSCNAYRSLLHVPSGKTLDELRG